MAEELEREQTAATASHARKFQEAPGEAEADLAHQEFLKSVGTSPVQAASALASVDGSARAHALNRLQEERGNSFVQRVVAESQGTPGRLVGESQATMVEEVQRRKGAGSPLPDEPRQQMEGFFGADLGNVRVHADGEASTLNRELNAHAFTVGSDVFFAEGKYNPTSSAGQGLLAHELTHVGQQTGLRQAAQRQAQPDEEEQVQRAAAPEEEEETVQRQAAPEEEEAVQRQGEPEEEEEKGE